MSEANCSEIHDENTINAAQSTTLLATKEDRIITGVLITVITV